MAFEQVLTDYRAALTWVGRLMSTTDPAYLDRPTPCEEFTVRDLLGHLLGTAYRGLATARGESATRVPHVVRDVPDEELGPTYARLAELIASAWSRVGPEEPVPAPWGECTGRRAVEGFTVETLVHGWDLAVATGRDPEELSDVAGRCLPLAGVVVPERLRGVMYDDQVPASRDDGPTTRLARALGRQATTPMAAPTSDRR